MMNNYSKRRYGHEAFIARLLIFLKKKGYNNEYNYINDIVEDKVKCNTYSNTSKEVSEMFIWNATPQGRDAWIKIEGEYNAWIIENRKRRLK